MIDEKPVVACYPRYPKKKPLAIIVTGNQIPYLENIEKPGPWVLLCGSYPAKSSSPQLIPAVWTTLDTSSKSIPLPGWPPPCPAQSIYDTLEISVKNIPFFSDGTTALFFRTATYNGLIIDGDFKTDSIIADSLKENVDLLIVCSHSPAKIKFIRSKIRPRYLISTSLPDNELKKLNNILFFRNSTSAIEFEIRKGNKLTLKASNQ